MSAELVTSVVAIVLSVVALLASVVQFLISRWDRRTETAETRLQDLEKSYAEVAQPAMAQLDAIKTQYPGDALWTALQFEPPTGNNMTPLEQQQLRVSQMDLMLAEQRARNAVKGFWNSTLRAMQEGKLPPAFGEASNDHIRFADDDWLYRANNFREVAEPFDIANYYRLQLDRASGQYLVGKNRPRVYTRLEKMWQTDLRSRHQNFLSSVTWAELMATVRSPPAPAAAVSSAVQRLPPRTLPTAGALPPVHQAP